MKNKLLISIILLALGLMSNAADLEQINPQDLQNNTDSSSEVSDVQTKIEQGAKYISNPNLKSGIQKYKNHNYTGCLQELFALTKKDPSNATAYYYMGMAYTHVGAKSEAIAAYEKVIALHPNKYLTDYAAKGRDCLNGGPLCVDPVAEAKPVEEMDELDKFINAPYGTGLSPELESQVRQKQLQNFQDTINKKEILERKDIEKIRKFDSKNSKSKIDDLTKIASNNPDEQEILNAINVLKNAGLAINVQPYDVQQMYMNPQYAEMSMLLGNNNNGMNMVPFMMAQAQSGKNIDPKLMQAMILNSMMPDMNFGNDNNNRF